MIARNLLGRLNARSPDNLQRIATFWHIPLPAGDRGRQVGALYRRMTDVRQVRSMWERLDPDARRIVREMARRESGGLTMDDIVALTGLTPAVARETAITLFHAGILSREGDTQELPIGVLPRLFLPREVANMVRRVQEEIDAGDLAGSPLRVLLESLDDQDLDDAAEAWGVRIVPGQRRRAAIVNHILRQIGDRDRVRAVGEARSETADALWRAVRESGPEPVPLDAAVAAAGLTPDPSTPDHARESLRLQDALTELETALLVFHTYHRDETRWLFVPREIAHPGETAVAIPLRPLQPLPDDAVPHAPAPSPFALAWDLLTVTREIAAHGAPVWTPGEAPSRPWQRRINRRLWHAGEEIPPLGYAGFLLFLGVSVGILAPSDQPLPASSDRRAIRPVVATAVREWIRLDFEAQMARLRDVWRGSDAWLEGWERDEIEFWGANWPGFRARLIGAIEDLDRQQWVLVEDLAARLAEQHPDLIGGTFTAATTRPTRNGLDERTSAIAQAVEVELRTALTWTGHIQLARTANGRTAARPFCQDPEGPASDAPELSISVSDEGLVTVLRPAPIHVWSLSAFADAESLHPEATFQLRPASVERALAAGFDLDQIVAYLGKQSGSPIPAPLRDSLNGWAQGYRRVRLRRAVVLTPDGDDRIDDLRETLRRAGVEVLANPSEDGTLIALLPAGVDAGAGDDDLLATLRAAGYAGQWDRPRRARKR